MHDDESPVELTDNDWAYLRFVRFGELPGRVRPDELVETAQTDRPVEAPPDVIARREWA